MQFYDEENGLYYEIRDAEGRSYTVITDADKKLTGVKIPDMLGGVPVEAVGKKAFLGCKGLREVIVPSSVKALGEWAFAFCDNLTLIHLPRVKMELGKGVFKNDRKLRDVSIYEVDDKSSVYEVTDRKAECAGEAGSRLLAAAPIYMDAEYLLDIEHAGACEWYNKWDTRLMHILSLKDDDGYHLYVLCGEEDLHFDYDQYLEYNREKKAYLCMLRLNNDVCLKDDIKERLRTYLLDHTIGSVSDAAIRVLLRDFGDEKEYYELMLREGIITPHNLEDVLLKMGDRHPQMKAFIIEAVRGDTGYTAGSFFDDLTL